MATCKIENNTARLIVLAPTPAYPLGLRLVPGLNNVPEAYLDELRGYTVRPEPDAAGKARPVRHPGREALEQLQATVDIVTTNGRHKGPQITIYTDDQAGREEGVPAPVSLDSYKEETAVALIKVTSDKKALKRWADDKRPAVASAARERM